MQRYRDKKIRVCDKNSIPLLIATQITQDKVFGWLQIKNVGWKKCRNILFLKIHENKSSVLHNTLQNNIVSFSKKLSHICFRRY